MKKKIDDGLTKYQRYRLKDLDEYRKKKREWAKTEEQREKRTLYMREWREKNRGQHNKLARESHLRNRSKPENVLYRKNYHYKTKYGISYEEFQEMLLKQNNKCYLCDVTLKKPHLDHSHETKKVRKILCVGCNTMLGRVEKIGTDKLKKYIS